jgi:ATP adenylyltransferase
MPYIEQSEPTPGCLFCVKASEDRDEANLLLYRAPRCFVIMNRFPYNTGHVMIAPFQHTGLLTEVEEPTGADIFRVIQLSVRALQIALGPDGFNVGVNQGKTAGAGIADHVHVHVVPRWDGDTNFMPVLADVKVIPELLAATYAKLKPYFDQTGSRP